MPNIIKCKIVLRDIERKCSNGHKLSECPELREYVEKEKFCMNNMRKDQEDLREVKEFDESDAGKSKKSQIMSEKGCQTS